MEIYAHVVLALDRRDQPNVDPKEWRRVYLNLAYVGHRSANDLTMSEDADGVVYEWTFPVRWADISQAMPCVARLVVQSLPCWALPRFVEISTTDTQGCLHRYGRDFRVELWPERVRALMHLAAFHSGLRVPEHIQAEAATDGFEMQ